MKGKGYIFAAACALALSAGLAGCSSGEGGSGADEATEAFVGEWTLESIESADAPMDSYEVELMAEEGLVAVLTLGADGSTQMNLFGVETAGTWEAQGADSIALTFGEDGMTATLSAGQLRLEDAAEEGGAAVEGVMIFNKTDAGDAASSESGEEASSSEAGEEASSSEAA